MEFVFARQRNKMALTTRVVGLLGRPEYHQAVSVLQSLHRQQSSRLRAPNCQPMMEFQWTHWLSQLRKELGGEAWVYQEPVAVFVEGDLLLGGLAELLRWIAESFSYHDPCTLTDYLTQATQAYNDHISNPERDYVFMDVCVEGDLIGRLVMELDSHLCPVTARNFLSLCEGCEVASTEKRLSYVNSLIHRVVPGGWVQGGDICGGSGSGGASIYGKVFEDECYAVPHSGPGVLGMANRGRNTNSSQFYLTLAPTPWMDRQYVAFGRVVEGSRVLQRLAGLETNNERPLERCQISNCGRLTPLVS